MRKHIRSVWARSNEHIKVRRGKQSPNPRKEPAMEINVILLVVAGYACWLVVNALLAVLEYVFALLVAVLPWLALAGGFMGVIYIIFGKSGSTRRR